MPGPRSEVRPLVRGAQSIVGFWARPPPRGHPTPRQAVSWLPMNLPLGYSCRVTWSEVVRKLRKAGYIELRTGKGSHMHLVNPRTGHRIVVVNHATQEAGHLGKRILKDAGIR